jgi:ABC-2 type transport system permease protein
MSVIYMFWVREIKRYLRSRVQLISSLGQPLLNLLVLGFGMGPMFQRAGDGSYLQFMAPGVIGMTILFTSIFSGFGVLWDRQFGFLKEILVAPVPRLRIMAGRTLGGATVAVMQGLLVTVICVLAGFRPVNLAMVPLALAFMVLIAVVFAAAGVAIGSSTQDMRGLELIMNFLVMPIFFLSGALFPLTGLPRALVMAATADPLSYGIDGMRNALLGAAAAHTQFGTLIDLEVLITVASVLLVLGAYRFSKIEA